ncbi:hypothetical protein J2Y88_005283 [Pseudomonas chlororaphis]|uniref:HD domain-containing protein n=1 Tax=Pseudomonas chlororaphis TaxID=587753 RepID=UPI00209EF652|nr:ATP-binding protein [Pseudomonas chlororaphis]MCP1482972.1 hypothetical protein [Pseudomonas chlororaphis]MCP1596671.1 hypothetical protein [Pseudomonas chlororaphis]
MEDYKKSPLWKQAFDLKKDEYTSQRNFLISAFKEFRERVSILVAQIHKDMPSLTVHDITHIDALWWTASEITGPDYPLNPAEAFVLGGAFLLHDSAHCIAAYPGGIEEIKKLPEWEVYCAKLKLDPTLLIKGTDQFQQVLFEVLRALHPTQARVLARQSWSIPGDSNPLFLLPQDDLRRAYSEVIGLIAESHWHYPHQLELLNHKKIMPPACLHPAPWTVDVLKLALILRTADAAHIDSQRAPRFLQALVNPEGFSLTHWNFQSRINKPKRDPDLARQELCFSGTSFPVEEQESWWMAYDTARMVDSELRAADRLLLDFHRAQFAVRSVANSHSSENFSKNIPTDGWHPVDTSIKITDINKMVDRFGGEKLYGKSPSSALRELIQNSVDSVHACRTLGGLGDEEGEIEITHEHSPQGDWLHITDTGVGMSRYVLTDVLLDFGKSLWKSNDLQGEWQNLIPSKFEATGKFGIGFFSVFMLGSRVKVITRRFEPKENESAQWLLDFTHGTEQRPTLRAPSENEKLKRHGTKVSILLDQNKLNQLCTKRNDYLRRRTELTFPEACARLAPALDINLFTQSPTHPRSKTIQANDWLQISSLELIKRICPGDFDEAKPEKNGPWTNMETIFKDNIAIGRIGVYDKSFYSSPAAGIGITNGILAGPIQGISGIVKVLPQEDLARSSATPTIATKALKVWADKQAETLSQKDIINTKISSLLAYYGANKEPLTIGTLGGTEITFSDFIKFCENSEILVIHDGSILHEEDDEVLSRQFYSSYEYQDHVLELDDTSRPSWIRNLTQDGPPQEECSILFIIEHTLQDLWKSYNFTENEKVRVGTVLGESIFRDCNVYKRPTQ